MNEYEEISLKDLILIILKGWKMIIVSIFVTLGIAGIVFFTNNSQTFSSSTQNTIIYKTEYTTEFGQYILPYANADALIILLKEDDFYDFVSKKTNYNIEKLMSSISFTTINSTDFLLNVVSNNKEEIELLTPQIVDYIEDYINYTIVKKALISFENSNLIKMTSFASSRLDKLNMLTYFEEQLKNTKILINTYTVNPMYSLIISNIIQYKASIVDIDFSAFKTETALKDIDKYLESYTSFPTYLRSTNKFTDINLHINHSEVEYVVTTKFSYKTLFPISIILGAMIGVFIVFFKNYWLNSSKKSIN